MGFPGGSVSKESSCDAGDPALISGLGRKDALKNRMATHSSILAWEFPWTEEPSGLPLVRSQESDHDLVTKPSPLMLQVYS